MNAINILFEQVEKYPSSMIKILKLKRLILISSSVINYLPYNIDDCSVIPLSRYPTLNDYEFDYNHNLLELLLHDKIQIFKVIDRYYSSINTKKTKFKNINDYYLKLVHYSYEIIKKYEIEILFTWDMPHSPLTYTLFVISKLSGIKVVGSKFLPSENYDNFHVRFISEEFPQLDKYFFTQLSRVKETYKSIKPEDLDNLSHQIYNKYRNFNNQPYLPNYGDRWKIFELFKSLLNRNTHLIFSSNFLAKLPRLIPYFKTFTVDKIYKIWLKNYIDSNSLNSLNTEYLSSPYIYFPLHYQPESTTIPLGGEFDNQLYIVDMVTKLLPDGFYLVIKEHPSYLYRLSSNEGMYLSRSRKFYKKLVNNKKVKFVGFYGNTNSLINFSRGVLTVSGTVAFEALAFNKPAITFGDYFINQLPNSYPVKNEKDLIFALENVCNTTLNYKGEYMYFLKALEKIIVDINLNNLKDESKVENELHVFFHKLIKLDFFKELYG